MLIEFRKGIESNSGDLELRIDPEIRLAIDKPGAGTKRYLRMEICKKALKNCLESSIISL